ncbi:uncharacterized protein LOC103516427 [Diaphorina citri]|uniref:Uncharacterized protein LOC103516427 n=1 Tax=Diaphorina citri TaxID=121845 RepID=A0A3Q0JD27_DIACI|nr:uncharacterized protein LOC103516427 [Diaphorina citri]
MFKLEKFRTIALFFRLYNDFKASESKYGGDLAKFYMDYTPLVHDDHMNCVGLTIRLRKQLVAELHKDFPDIDRYLFYTGGEMRLASRNDLLTRQHPSLRGDEKWKHVALALHFSIKDRPGYFFLDQSFSVPVVTLMKDGEYPQKDNFSIPYKYNQDEYLYRLSPNGAFINFTRYGVDFLSTDARQATGAFYLHQAHDSILNITEKRAIIKQKRSIVARLPTMRRPLDVDVLLHNGSIMEIYEEGKYFPQYVAGKINLTKTNLSDPDLVRILRSSEDCRPAVPAIVRLEISEGSPSAHQGPCCHSVHNGTLSPRVHSRTRFPPVPTHNEAEFIPKPHWSPVYGPLMFNSTEDLEQFRDRLGRVHTDLLNVTYNSANSLFYFLLSFCFNNRPVANYLTSKEYEDSEEAGGDILYDNFVQYIHSLKSEEVMNIWKVHRYLTTDKHGSTSLFPFPHHHTYCCQYSTHHPNATPPANDSLELFTRPFNYQVPDMDL